ncbi:hypothetical protein ACLB2K_074949 [Fragaria x ananassa]
MINILTTNFPLRLGLQVCGIAMYFTYINGLITISPGETAGCSAAGHVEFVKVILELKLKPSLAKELNKDGFSSMHVASANGHLEIVRALQRAEPGCSQVKGNDQWTPLHCAARRGRVEIIREIVSACPVSFEDVTVLRETVLHLAVKNSQFEAIRVLLELLREMDKLHVLNMKDNLGNSVLHLATWKKQHQASAF